MVPDAVRRIPSTVGGVIYLLALVATAVGLAVVEWGPWRRGVTVIGIAILVGAAARAVLNDRDSGMLRVRSKPFDLAVLTGLGVLLIVLASVIPSQPTV